MIAQVAMESIIIRVKNRRKHKMPELSCDKPGKERVKLSKVYPEGEIGTNDLELSTSVQNVV